MIESLNADLYLLRHHRDYPWPGHLQAQDVRPEYGQCRIFWFVPPISCFRPSRTMLLDSNAPSTGAIVSVYNAGQAIGGMTVGYLADKISRKYTIGLAALLSTY